MLSSTVQTLFFGRVVTAMVTPFSSDMSVNYSEAARLARDLIDHGTDSILLAGTTGETPTLTHEEEENLFTEVKKAVQGRAKIIAGTGSNCTKTAITSSQQAEKIGVDAVLQVVPYYNKPSQRGLVAHFSEIAKAISIPIMLYNIPGRTGINMLPETVAELAQIPNIIALKEAANDKDQVRKTCTLVDDNFCVYSGDDANTLDFLKNGAKGVVSVASHLVGNDIKEMITAYCNNDVELAETIHKKLLPLFKALFITTNPSPLKAALNLLGYSVGGLRLPLLSVSDSEEQIIKKALLDLQLLH